LKDLMRCVAALMLALGSSFGVPVPLLAQTSPVQCANWLSPEFYAEASAQDVRFCLDSGQTVEARTEAGETPLHLAAAHARRPEVVQALLAAGADVTLTTLNGYTPLHSAAADSSVPAVLSLLLVWDSEIAALVPPETCRTPIWTCATTALHLVASRPNGASVMAALVSGGAPVNALDEKQRTPLHRSASTAGHPEVALLLQAKADTSVEDEDGEGPLHAIARRMDADPEAVRALLAGGASPDAPDNEGVTPLILAAAYTGSPIIFRELLGSSSKPCHQDKRGRSAISVYALNKKLQADSTYWDLHERCSK